MATCETAGAGAASGLGGVPRTGEGMAEKVEAPITGKIWKIEKQVGDALSEGETILIIESMKMEIPVEAPCAGTLSEIRVEEGQAISEFDVLAVID
jgi:acetyl-CoA carboxylase biotin carboxyl carrier protein